MIKFNKNISVFVHHNMSSANQKINCTENGRSMIEMLGVLAIIGVLSVGGIAGYSKAMMKYRINKTIEQISLISSNVRTFFSQQKDYTGVFDTLILRKAKLIPDEMWDNTGTTIQNAFGGQLTLSEDASATKMFSLLLKDVPQEACIEIATNSWPNENFAIWIADNYESWGSSNSFVYNGCLNTEPFSVSAGDYKACRTHGELPIALEHAIVACTCATDNLCDIRIAYQ